MKPFKFKISLFVLLLISVSTFAQSMISAQSPLIIRFKDPIEIEAIEKLGDSIKVGDRFKIKELIFNKNGDDSKPSVYLNFTGLPDGKSTLSIKNFKKFSYTKWSSTDQAWNSFLIDKEVNKGFLYNINSKIGFQYDVRNEMFSEANLYLDKLIQKNTIFKDDYFEDYLYSLVTKIHSGVLSDGRPGNISIKIIKNTDPNAFCLANGTILITTGLLSTIESEDELVSILAHEIAHFVMDHSISNYNFENDKKKKAEFWSIFATTIAAGTDILLSSENKNHPTGILTASVAITSAILSNDILNKLGLKYSHEQELEADLIARQILGVLKYNEYGLGIALKRIKQHNILTGNYLALSGSGSHPNIEERIEKEVNQIDENKYSQTNYLAKASFINSYNAEIELYFSHHLKALNLVEKNIKSSTATESDYILKAKIIRRLFSSKEKMEEVILLLNKAKSLDISKNIVISKEEGITLSRIGRNLDAKKSFETYLLGLIELQKKEPTSVILENEIEWTKKIIFKVGQSN